MSNLTIDTEQHLGGNAPYGDPFTHCPAVWNYVIKRLAIKSVLDLGSGTGYSANYFYSEGLQVIAVDGLKENCDNAVFPTIRIDLTKSSVDCRVDLVHCHEVVEHVEEKYLDNLLASLCCGKFLLMTHALPGQGGHHHVNEQPVDYWVKHLNQRGFEVLDEDTSRIRYIANNERAIYMAETGLLLVNKNR